MIELEAMMFITTKPEIVHDIELKIIEQIYLKNDHVKLESSCRNKLPENLKYVKSWIILNLS